MKWFSKEKEKEVVAINDLNRFNQYKFEANKEGNKLYIHVYDLVTNEWVWIDDALKNVANKYEVGKDAFTGTSRVRAVVETNELAKEQVKRFLTHLADISNGKYPLKAGNTIGVGLQSDSGTMDEFVVTEMI